MTGINEELYAFVKKIADLRMCGEPGESCSHDSGPYCSNHDWQVFDSDIQEARAIIAKVG